MTLTPGDLVMWEAGLVDGTVLREADGHRYADLPLEHLSWFRLRLGTEVLCELPVPLGADGRCLRFRRDVAPAVGAQPREVRLKVGWVPMGPAIAIDPARGEAWVAPSFHQRCDATCEHPAGAFWPPVAVGREREA